uniref:Uncharacterized protein AlNc14C22G2307 n=1 Tax=Albugo laibachii Nc14 TaxID=890382 RepID=F0W602_9STRA|nr:conserved hypothetical protein [Albugo laibachii Nc14]|eukprot:CCA16544.1 conserved hypothetical protein [Albugo laibachii Nc14]
MSKRCIVLVSSIVITHEQNSQITRLQQIFRGNKIRYEEIDCSLEENRVLRDKFILVSGLRGHYPQVFLQNKESEEIEYLGTFDRIQELNELNDLPAELIQIDKTANLRSVFMDVDKVA